ncbi:MAG TPA: PqiC family protein [Nitrospira sp.]|nr:PqiC family protein [Nitrospira sp.]
MSTPTQRAVVLFILGMVMSAAGCAHATQERFYTLSDSMPDGTADAPIGNNFVEILPVSLPELLDRPQVVLYDEAGRVHILEEDRWAATLKSEIRRSIGEKVRHRLGMIDVYHTPAPHGESVKGKTYRITVSVESFKVAPGHGTMMQAVWAVRSIDGNADFVCRSAYQMELGERSLSHAILAYRKAIDALGTRIAQSIRNAAQGPRDGEAEQGECVPR